MKLSRPSVTLKGLLEMTNLLLIPDAYTAVSQAQCEALLADGYAGLMAGAWGGYAPDLYNEMQANAQNSLRNMRQAGGLTSIYTNGTVRWVYSWGTIGPKNWWEETQKACGPELAKVSFIELDFEIKEPPLYIQSEDMLEFIADLRTVGVPLEGYSGPWFTDAMAEAGQRWDYSDVLDGYCHADYQDTRPTLEVGLGSHPMHPRLVGHQYSGGTILHGTNFDLNAFDSAFVKGAGEDMTAAEVQTAIATLKHGDCFGTDAGYEAYLFLTEGGNRRIRHITSQQVADREGYKVTKTLPYQVLAVLKRGDDII
jgi:hypothetical protein